ncbi:MAG: MBL fold metallo-hydrolase [Negativicutes bacterium]
MSLITTIPMGFSNAILVQEKGTILVDTGAPATTDKYRALFANLQVDPQDIGLIVITHGHSDHFAHAHELRELTGAPILCHSKALPALRTGKNPPVHPRNELGESVLKMISGKAPAASRSIEPDILIDSEFELAFYGIAGKIIPTPGHSNCSLSVLLDSGAAIVGDMVVSSPFTGKASIAYFADDPERLFTNVRMLLPHTHTFHSGHGGPFTREQVEAALPEPQ